MPRRIRNLQKRRRRTYLREWRLFHNKTQKVVADALDMSPAQLSRIETGEMPYTQDVLEALADVYQTDPPSLLIRNPLDPDGIWSVWENAAEGQRRTIVEVAKSIVKTGT